MALRKFILKIILLGTLLSNAATADAQYNKDYFYWASRRCLMNREYQEAIRVLNILLRADPDAAEGYFLRGVAKFNLDDLLGADSPRDMAALIEPSAAGALTEPDIVATSMRVAPGVTLWGPVAAPEQAELMARPVELLLDVLRRESDVVFIDTSVFWGDAVAAAVAASDRCLVVGDAAVSSATSASRVIELASRVGVPRTRMSAVFNRFGARGADEDVAMRFEIACALSSKIRIADGGQDLAALMAFGRADEAVGQTSAFATSVREATREMLVELGCAVGPWSDMVADRATRTERPRIRLPWSREGDQR